MVTFVSKQGFLTIISTLIFAFFIARGYFPKLIGRDVYKNMHSIIKTTNNVTKLSKREGKKIILKRYGKSDRQILVDTIATDTKNIMKYGTIVIPVVLRNALMFNQYAFSMLTYFIVSKGLKTIVGKTRPDGSNRRSFPSGHTASAFLSATFLHTHFGLLWGVPLYILAALVGFSRIYCGRHDIFDVFGGAVVSIVSVLIFTKLKFFKGCK